MATTAQPKRLRHRRSRQRMRSYLTKQVGTYGDSKQARRSNKRR